MDMPHKVTREQQLKLPTRKVKMGNSGFEHSTDVPGHISVTSVTAVTRNARLSPGYPGGVGSEGPWHWTQRLFGTIGVVTEVTLVTMADDLTRTVGYRNTAERGYAWALSHRSSKDPGELWNHSDHPYEPGLVIEKVDDSRGEGFRHLCPLAAREGRG